jgi:hypothetical protein
VVTVELLETEVDEPGVVVVVTGVEVVDVPGTEVVVVEP